MRFQIEVSEVKYYQITGDECIALNKRKEICVLDSKIKIYDADYKLIKKFSKIRYPNDMEVDTDEKFLYISTTENYVHIIDLDSLEIIDTITIDIYPGSKKKNDFGIERMTLFDGSLYFNAVQLRENLLLKYDLEKKFLEIIFRGEAITEIEIEGDTLYSDSKGVYVLARFGKKLLNKIKVVKNELGLDELYLEEPFFHLCSTENMYNGIRMSIEIVCSNFVFKRYKKLYYAEKCLEEWKFKHKERFFGRYNYKYFEEYDCVVVREMDILHPKVTTIFLKNKEVIEHSFVDYIDCALTNEGLFLLKERDEDIDTSKQYSAFIPFAELGLE